MRDMTVSMVCQPYDNLMKFFDYTKMNPFSIGLETLWDALDLSINNNRIGNYPPYNIVRTESGYKVIMAVAGFKKSDITITHDRYDLTIQGAVDLNKPTQESMDENVIHQGIARRSFIRNFAIGKNLRVTSAEMKEGILTVNIEKGQDDERQELKIS